MTINFPAEAAISEAKDDLTCIKGIGQAVQDRLYQAGISSYVQLAAMTPKRISKLLADMIGMTPEKIKMQDWVGQARQLIPNAQPNEPPVVSGNVGNHQHYETFSVKLLEDVSNRVRRTNIVHVQKGVEQNWAGWDERRLIAFIVDNAKLNIKSTKRRPSHKEKSILSENIDPFHAQVETSREKTGWEHPHRHKSLTINAVNIYQAENRTTAGIIPTDQDWSIKLEWTLSGPGPLFGNWLIKVYLESMGPGCEYVFPDDEGLCMALVDGNIKAPETYFYSTAFKFKAGEIEAGLYWLVVSISWEKHPGKLGDLMQVSEKRMLQFYPRQ